jgi:hypothetical protein
MKLTLAQDVTPAACGAQIRGARIAGQDDAEDAERKM